MRAFLLLFTTLSSALCGCSTTTNIVVPDVPSTAPAVVVDAPTVFLDVRKPPAYRAISVLSPAGMTVILPSNDAVSVADQLLSNLRSLVEQKGFRLVDVAEASDFTLLVEYETFVVRWQQKMLVPAAGDLRFSFRHALIATQNDSQIWRWQHRRTTTFGFYPGHLWVVPAVLSVVGAVPFLVWMAFFVDGPLEQISTNVSAELVDYTQQLAKVLPDADHSRALASQQARARRQPNQPVGNPSEDALQHQPKKGLPSPSAESSGS